MRASLPSISLIVSVFVSVAVAREPAISKNQKSKRSGGGFTTQAAAPLVQGSGTLGRIPKWIFFSGYNYTLGDSVITESNGKIGIGTNSPASKLTVEGMIETTLGGYKFPDGTVQTTAAVSGLQSVIHNSTLTGNGTAGSPLGIAVPLILSGTTPALDSVLNIANTGEGAGVDATGGFAGGTGVGGNAVVARGGSGLVGSSAGGSGVQALGGSSSIAFGGRGVIAQGGFSNSGLGGTGVEAIAGSTNLGQGGKGVNAQGGDSSGFGGGDGVRSIGGNSNSNIGGTGIDAAGGESFFGSGGPGIRASGGRSLQGIGGIGVDAKGADSNTAGAGGNGVQGKGGESNGGSGGNGVVATGGSIDGRGVIATGGVGSVGYGVEAKGGASLGAGHVAGAGIKTIGGPSTGSNSASGTGILAIAGEATNGATRGRAGIFEGDVSVSEHLTAGSLDVTGTKNFKIDHPLDPENKYLLHAAIESSEVLNVYSGNVVTNAKGEAVITLPDWFEALNQDLRYQLTVVGAFAQAIVGEKVKRNHFTIKTNIPNVEVSWQVTGVRSDEVMRRHPFKAEQNKFER